MRVVLSMRADFLDRLAGHKQFLAELSRGLFFLSAPDHDNLRETLVRPAELAGYTFEDPSIVDDMMQAATSRGALPLLQFAATRLWDARDRERKLLTVAAYEQMGGVGGAFARHADEVAAAVPPQSQALLRAIMTRLVTPEGTRAVVDHDELLGLSRRHAEVESILDQLVRARLVSLHTDPKQGATVEIVHEVLITEWPTLARWLEDSQALRGFMHELRQAVKQWVARGKPSDLVWRGATKKGLRAVTCSRCPRDSTPEVTEWRSVYLLDPDGGHSGIRRPAPGAHEHQRGEHQCGNDRDRRGRFHDGVARHQSDLHPHWLPECLDTVHSDVERARVADHRAAGLPLLCGEWRTDRSELGLHRHRYRAVRLQRTNANPNPDPNTNANADTNQHIWHYALLLESSHWPSAKCHPHANWYYIGLNIVRRLR